MLSTSTELQEILQLAPEWAPVAAGLAGEPVAAAVDLFSRLGAKAIYQKALAAGDERRRLLVLVRDGYFHGLLAKMLRSNQNLRRFWSQRRLSSTEQAQNVISLATELAQKMDGVLAKHLSQQAEDGFRVLLPAYLQRAVQNAVVDYIRQEWNWEKRTLQDLSLDPEQEDPRQNVADDLRYSPENLALSGEQIGQLNKLNSELKAMLADSSCPRDALQVIDCLFGLGLTEHSRPGVEMTMRECCDKLSIPGETQARRIARCQVLLDKGLDLIRQRVREKLPTIVESWQAELNVNCASRRELEQQLEMTEGEVERLIKSRQYRALKELVDRLVIKPARLDDITARGAVAAFVPVDINQATVRDLIDILGLTKPLAQKLAGERPFSSLSELTARGLVDQQTVAMIVERGAVAKAKAADSKRVDLNRADLSELVAGGVAEAYARLITRGRPFLTWAELEEYLGCEPPTWTVLRQKFCLGLSPA